MKPQQYSMSRAGAAVTALSQVLIPRPIDVYPSTRLELEGQMLHETLHETALQLHDANGRKILRLVRNNYDMVTG
jgi:hypothetical protein